MKQSAGAATYLLGTALVITIVIIAVWSERLAQGYAFKDNMAAAAAATVTALLAVSLFVERAMAVLNAIIFGDEHRQAEANLLGSDPARGAEEMIRVLGKKERVRLLGAFLAGALVSAAGVRTLEGLLAVPAQNPPSNPFLLPVDVVLTAGLIAGGSNGLAFLLQLIKDVLAPPEQATTPVTGTPPNRTGGKVDTIGAAEDSARPARSKFFRARLTTG